MQFYDKSTNRLVASGEHNVMSPLASSKHNGPTNFDTPISHSEPSTSSSRSSTTKYSQTQLEPPIVSLSSSTALESVSGGAPPNLKSLATDLISSRRAYCGSFSRDIRERIQLRNISVLDEDDSAARRPLFSSAAEVDVTPSRF